MVVGKKRRGCLGWPPHEYKSTLSSALFRTHLKGFISPGGLLLPLLAFVVKLVLLWFQTHGKRGNFANAKASTLI